MGQILFGQCSISYFSLKAKELKNIVYFGVFTYIFFVSWNDVLALNDWVKLPFIFLFLAIFACCIDLLLIRRVKVQIFCKIDLLIFAFFITYLLSALINQNESTSNYLLAYFYVFFILYILLKVILYTYVTERQIYIANAWGVFFLGVFLSLDFILSSVGIVNLQEMLPLCTVLGYRVHLISRSKGFACIQSWPHEVD